MCAIRRHYFENETKADKHRLKFRIDHIVCTILHTISIAVYWFFCVSRKKKKKQSVKIDKVIARLRPIERYLRISRITYLHKMRIYANGIRLYATKGNWQAKFVLNKLWLVDGCAALCVHCPVVFHLLHIYLGISSWSFLFVFSFVFFRCRNICYYLLVLWFELRAAIEIFMVQKYHLKCIFRREKKKKRKQKLKQVFVLFVVVVVDVCTSSLPLLVIALEFFFSGSRSLLTLIQIECLWIITFVLWTPANSSYFVIFECIYWFYLSNSLFEKKTKHNRFEWVVVTLVFALHDTDTNPDNVAPDIMHTNGKGKKSKQTQSRYMYEHRTYLRNRTPCTHLWWYVCLMRTHL